jgi:hypothetical protein
MRNNSCVISAASSRSWQTSDAERILQKSGVKISKIPLAFSSGTEA